MLYLFCSFFFFACKQDKPEVKNGKKKNPVIKKDIDIIPISHATAVITWNDFVFYLDPTGGAEAFHNQKKADLVLITDIHEDHFHPKTLQGIGLGNAKIVGPEAVISQLPESLNANTQIINNEETIEVEGFKITAVPMYNLREEAKDFHPKGRGNGYIIEKDGQRLYIAGDTEDIPEMRNLENISIALIPMNLPYTMPMEKAADAVLEFEPKKVIPYHYRGENGMQNIEKFKALIHETNNNIEVVIKDWYPEEEDNWE